MHKQEMHRQERKDKKVASRYDGKAKAGAMLALAMFNHTHLLRLIQSTVPNPSYGRWSAARKMHGPN